MKRILAFISAAAVAATIAAPRVAIAQEKELVPLKIQLVVSRHQGDKKISSMPYTLWVTANNPQETKLRMGVDVPVVSTVFQSSDKPGQTPMSSYSYRPIGTNIDCLATTTQGGFNVRITLNDSAIQFETREGLKQGVPAFRNFSSQFYILLKDGQTAQYTAATDPVSGEVLKVEATLNVLK